MGAHGPDLFAAQQGITMTANGYDVFFFPQALEALGEAIKPYLQEGPSGACVRCKEIDTAGSLIEMTLEGRNPQGQHVDTQLMVPTAMVRMIVSAHSDGMFGFGPHAFQKATDTLPPVGPTGKPASAAPDALPHSEAEPVAASASQATSQLQTSPSGMTPPPATTATDAATDAVAASAATDPTSRSGS